jgi:PhoPQ-activated pathogenicity-related protein
MTQRLLVMTLALLLTLGCAGAGPLDDYMAKRDPHYAWKVIRADRSAEGTFAVLYLSSQAWRTGKDVDRILWHHWLEVYVPAKVEHDIALLEIAGGDSEAAPPDTPNGYLAETAIKLRAVTARVSNVPNQPLGFLADPVPQRRREDGILSFAWARHLESGDPEWLCQLPMARSAVKAMDAVTEYCATGMPASVAVRQFVVTGASKRGWTSWLTAAADRRVVGVAPKVIDLLNIEPSFRHHHEAYGGYADAVHDYVAQGIMQRRGEPAMLASQAIIDPWAYRDRLTMPKMIINSTGDQFFLPDSWRFYWNDLAGPKFLRYIPNTDHGLNPTAGKTVRSFFASILNGRAMPNFTWKETAPGRVRVEVKDAPRRVLAWRAANPDARDFMLKTTGPAWKAEELQTVSPGVYEATATRPARGWAAVLAELYYDDPAGYPEPLVLTSGVSIAPDTMPHPE